MNQKSQIIKNQIKANHYITDEWQFNFKDIEKEFEEYAKYLLKKEEMKLKKENIDEVKKLTNHLDYGLSL